MFGCVLPISCEFLSARCLTKGPAVVYTEAGELPVRAAAERPRGEDQGGVRTDPQHKTCR